MPLRFTENPHSGGLRFSSNTNTSLSATTNPRTALSAHGLVEATLAEALGGTVTGRYMSPLRVQQKLEDIDLTAGSGLTGGGNIGADRTFTVGAGTGITVNADDVALDITHVRNAAHPATSTDNAIARYDSTAGALQNSGILIDDSNNLTLPNTAWLKGRNAANNADLSMFRVNSSNFTEWSNPLYYDSEGTFTNRNAVLHVERNIASPSSIQPNLWNLVQGKGDNTTFIGVSAAYFQARDRTDVIAGTKGVLYGLQLSVVPRVARSNFPFDDVVGLVVSNDGSAQGTEAIYVGHNVSGGGRDFAVGLNIDAYTNEAVFAATGTHTYGLDFCRSTGATFSQAAIRIPNNASIVSRNAANNADVTAAKVNASDNLDLFGGKATLSSSGLMITDGLRVGFTGTPTADKIEIGDANFSLDLGVTVANFAAIIFDSNDSILYDRPSNQMRFLIGGSDKLTIDNSAGVVASLGLKSSHATAGVGYATGAGGTVTQGAGSGKATAITLNTATGAITMNNAALNAGVIVTFVFNNSAVAATDLIVTAHESVGTTGAYTINARATGAGTAAIDVRNNTAGNLSEAIVIRFAVIKAVSA